MLRLINEVEKLLAMLSNNSEVITYEGYSKLTGEYAITRSEWDDLILVVTNKQMLPCDTMKVTINSIKKLIAEQEEV